MKKKTSIIFTGDIGFDRYMTGRFEDENLLSQDIVDFFHTGDHVVANVEGAMCSFDSASDPNNKGIFCHFMSPRAIKFLNKINADIYSIANNHSMDAGEAGLREELNFCAENNVRTVGAGLNIEEASRILKIDEAGGIGIIAVAYQPQSTPAGENSAGNFSMDDFELIEKRVKEIKKTCRWAVVIVHGGEEFTALPMPYHREYYLKYASFGADVIVGHHPHVVENYEVLPDGKTIFYSLGNFVFDTDYQRAQINTDRGILLKLTFTENDFSFEPFGIKIVRGEERVESGEVPKIFTEVNAADYERLVPLASETYYHAFFKKVYFERPDLKNADKKALAEYLETQPQYKKVLKLSSSVTEAMWDSEPRRDIVDYLKEEFD